LEIYILRKCIFHILFYWPETFPVTTCRDFMDMLRHLINCCIIIIIITINQQHQGTEVRTNPVMYRRYNQHNRQHIHKNKHHDSVATKCKKAMHIPKHSG